MELDLIQAIQAFASPFWDGFFTLATLLGEQYLPFLIYGWLYWNVDKEKGLAVGYAVTTSLVLNGGIKDLVRAPRPIGEPGVRSLRVETATGYSFPSGHTQAAAALGTAVSLELQKRWVTVLSALLMVLVGLSRLYLGVHWPRDVLGGLVLGVGVSCLCCWLHKLFANRNLLYGATFLVLLPFAWMADSPDYYKALGLLGGFVVGSLFEGRFVRFTIRGGFWRKLLRLLVGILLLLLVMEGIKPVLPAGNLYAALRYALVGFTAIGLYPWIFMRLRL